jgi:hypothetical protein
MWMGGFVGSSDEPILSKAQAIGTQQIETSCFQDFGGNLQPSAAARKTGRPSGIREWIGGQGERAEKEKGPGA